MADPQDPQDAPDDVPDVSGAPDAPDAPADPELERLLGFLRDSRSFDFTGYKRPSLTRRIRHRMREVGVTSYDEYGDVLRLQPDEFTALFNTILINVTSFFRDADAWTALERDVLPGVLEASQGGPIRVWSAGSAAGQEAYSIAMLLHEMVGSGFRERVKIYATDVDEEALAHARQASYTEREVAGLPERYRERYLDQVGGRFVVTPDLRRSVIFGRNDLTRDAPISRIDVLLCRNTLMYFNAETQSRIVNRLAFALRPDGVLFLGKAEMLLNHASVFDPIDLKRRFFRRVRVDVAEGSGFTPPWRSQSRAVVADNAAQPAQRAHPDQPGGPDRGQRRRSVVDDQPPGERRAGARRPRPRPPLPGPRGVVPSARACGRTWRRWPRRSSRCGCARPSGAGPGPSRSTSTCTWCRSPTTRARSSARRSPSPTSPGSGSLRVEVEAAQPGGGLRGACSRRTRSSRPPTRSLQSTVEEPGDHQRGAPVDERGASRR
ncbi:hypothetical protein GCM10025868_01190 [Angustibacter aerolatus]|uniref:protein-glutamate O-methyltransferase n=1 Tax=Angustibacter aerolatus TaxID=1162965 RepID=A0ABQ6JAQ3_9ACTN|nr:protein-glutamate O-methyltransferase CheR [Angustibacter aerolatus]GMA84869.1 hypothetical protein GCM10025868_01190 [Angustibacter aerolatus]